MKSNNISEYLDLIADKIYDIEKGCHNPGDKESEERLKTILTIFTLGEYLKERFDQELMDNLEMYNQGKRH